MDQSLERALNENIAVLLGTVCNTYFRMIDFFVLEKPDCESNLI